MDNNVAIKVENVSKKFCKTLKKSMLYGLVDIGKNILGLRTNSGTLRSDEFLAVDNVSFEVKRGETLGLIGPNGSGKTTLLKMLNGIFWPDKGKISIRGKVGALIAVGAGFHPLLTGRENIYVNSAVLGMNRHEVNKKFDSIVEFADIGDFLDMPVKNYSSGMFVRLGFSVAVHCEPDILLVDEVLAVGDSNFIIKSLNKVSSLIKESNMSLIFVSHSNTMIKAVCKKALYIENGICKKIGNAFDVVEAYEADCLEKRKSLRYKDKYQRIKSRHDAGIDRILLLDKDGREKTTFKIGDFLKIRAHVVANIPLDDPSIQIAIFDEKGECILSQISKTDNIIFPAIYGKAYIDFAIPEIPFNVGLYPFSVKLMDGSLIDTVDYHVKTNYIAVESGGKSGFNGKLWINGKWKICNA